MTQNEDYPSGDDADSNASGENPFFVELLEALVLVDAETQQLAFPEPLLAPIKSYLFESINGPESELAVEGFMGALGALDDQGHTTACEQLMKVWTEMLEQARQLSTSEEDKLNTRLTGSSDMSRFKPVGVLPPPKGSFKATDFIRPLPKARG